MMASRTALLPCPFCGVRPDTGPADPGREGDAWTWIRCVNPRCGVQPEADAYAERGHYGLAARKWNNRAPST